MLSLASVARSYSFTQFHTQTTVSSESLCLMKIDIWQGQMTLSRSDRSKVVRGRAQPLLCLLIVEEGRFITANEVHALPGWNAMSRDSVGKQVARIIDELAEKELNPITWRNKTNGWQLTQQAASDLKPETRVAARNWLNSHGWAQSSRFSSVAPAVVAEWALAASAAALALTDGRTEDGLQDLRRAYAVSDHPDLKAIADLLTTRIGQRLTRPHAPVRREQAARSVFDLAVEARRTAAYAIQSDSSAWASQVAELRGLLPELATAGSLTAQAYVHNALALLLRRLGHYRDALAHATEAAPLAVFSGDLSLMQAVLFNFGNIASELRRQDPSSVPEGLAISLIEADRAIRRRFGLGMDSAQAELLLAYLAYEERAFEKAEAYLKDARAIIAVSNISTDNALEARISGLLLLARGELAGFAMLDRAISTFEELGNIAAAAHVRKERHEYQAALR